MPRLRAPRVLLATLAAAVLAGSAGLVAALDTPTAAAAAAICDEFGRTTTTDGRYVVQNNRWGTAAQQCIEPNGTGFRVSTADGAVPTDGAPKSYPSVYWGCHYAVCTPGFSPIAAASPAFGTIRTTASVTYPTTGEWDASYDLWFDPTARRDGQNTGAEVMVWLGHAGRPQPIGAKVGTVTLAGGTWDVWFGNTGWNVVSYVRTAQTTTADFAVSAFFDDALARGYVQRSWYLTSVQAGFEPWVGGTGLALSGFTAGPAGTTAPTPTAPTPTAVPTPGPTAPVTATPVVTRSARPTSGRPLCTATATVDSAWGSGAVQNVSVTNGPAPRQGWTTTLTLPAGATVTNLWNGSWTQTGRTVTVGNLDHNGALAAGSGTTFGYQLATTGGAGSTAAPTPITCT